MTHGRPTGLNPANAKGMPAEGFAEFAGHNFLARGEPI